MPESLPQFGTGFESYQEAPDIPPETHIWALTHFYCEQGTGAFTDPDDDIELQSLRDVVSSASGLPVTPKQIRDILIERRTWQMAAEEAAKVQPYLSPLE